MELRIDNRLAAVAALVMVLLSASPVRADEETADKTAPPPTEPSPRTEKLASFVRPAGVSELELRRHPLYPALELAQEALVSINENIQDYTCKMVRRERIDGKVGKHEFLNLKIRHERDEDDKIIPFSVYLRFEKPASVAGREALYVEGRNAGKVFVRRGGQRLSYMSSYIKPDSRLAMRENRYPITDIGFLRMGERLLEIIENDIQYDECEVNFYKGAKVGKRKCTRIEVIHPVEREHFSFHRAMVFVDNQDKLPVGYVSYYWPREKGGKPRLLEEYVFTDIKLNVGLTDEDFDRENPEYGFARGEEVERDDDDLDEQDSSER